MPVTWSEVPDLRGSTLVAAFEGWNDAADAATDAARFIGRSVEAREIGQLDPGEYVDFQAQRPQVEIVGGVIRALTYPITRVLAGTTDRRLALISGHEPNFHWRGYCQQILDIAERLGCTTIVSLGALLADAPHSRPVRITGTASDPEAAARLGMHPSTYEGPTGIVGALHAACREASVPSFSLWAPVPHYAATPPSPKVTRALVERLGAFVDLAADLGRLDVAAEAWERQVGELVDGEPELSGYVRHLEEQYDISVDDSDLPSGDSLAADFQRYLRDQPEP